MLVEGMSIGDAIYLAVVASTSVRTSYSARDALLYSLSPLFHVSQLFYHEKKTLSRFTIILS